MVARRTDTIRWLTEDDISEWRSAQVLAMEPAAAAIYENKVNAIKQYVSGAPLKLIEAATGISRQHLYYLIRRCQMQDADGRPAGYICLISGKHLSIRKNSLVKLTAGRALPGALQTLFAHYPNLKNTMIDVIVDGKIPGSTKISRRLTWAMIQEIFEEECTKTGIYAPHYPFCSSSNGSTALMRWGRKLKAERKRRKSLDDYLEISAGSALLDPPSWCFERVEGDGHYIDLNWTIEVPSLRGEGVVRIKVSRLWLIALIETKSSAVIGYSVSLNKANYSAADVARAVRSSLVPWTPRELSVTGIAYKSGECLPNALDERLSYLCYDELWLDNARSHLSDLFLSVLERTVNAVPVFGPRAAPNARPNIEMLFDLLEEAGIHPLDGTTGSSSKDQRRSGKKDDQYLLSLDAVLDLIDLLIVRYNTGIAPGTTISRLEVLKRAIERDSTVWRRLSIDRRKDCMEYDLFDTAKIGKDKNDRVVRWKGARYHGGGLFSQPGLLGQDVLVMAQSLDLRKIKISLISDGSDLGVLEVEPRWNSTAHTIWTRAVAGRTENKSGFLRHAADIPLAMRAHAEREAAKNKRAKRVLAQLYAEQQLSVGVCPPSRNREIDAAQDRETVDLTLEDILDDDADAASLLERLGSVYR